MDSMDFHSLSRRELQCLCKKNKIPANMTNIAMADALTSLTNVIGIEEIGQSESTMPETPLTSRRTTVRKTATKPPAVESESTLTRPRRATTAKKIIKEEDSMDMSETTSVNETPAPRTGRRRVTGTSVCRKLDAQTQEVKEEIKEERPVVHSYSTRRSSRLQSGQKITESVQKMGGRKTDVVMIGVLSEEETDDVPMKLISDAIDEVQENQGDNVMVLSPIPDAPQEDLISEDGSSSTLVSANVSSCIEEFSSANEDLISMSKSEFSIEQSSEQQDMSTEISSCMNDANVSEISVSEVTLISESKVEITSEDDSHADQDMLVEDSNVASDDIDNMEIKEPAVEVTVKSPNVSSQKTAQMTEASPLEEKTNAVVMTEASPLEEKTNAVVKQVGDMSKCIEDQNAIEYGLKFSFEDGFSDSESDVRKSSFDFEDMKETMENISNLERSIHVENRVESSLECEKLDGVEMQEYQTTDLPGLNLTDATVSSPVEVASKGDQVKSDDSVSVELFENQKVGSVKCDSIANEGVKVDILLDDASTDEEDSVKCDSIANEEAVKVDSLLGDASTDEEDSNNESDEDESVDDESDEDDETVGDDDKDETVDNVKCDSIANKEGVKVDSLLGDASTDEEDSDNESDEDESVGDESDEDDETVGDDDEDESVDDVESDDNVDEIHESPVAGHLKIQNPVTPLKPSSAKKSTTPNSKVVIKVFEDTEESNKSGKVTLKSNSKLQTPGVAEEKENSDNNKGASTAEKSMRKKSLRTLKKMMKELSISIEEKKKTMGKENLQVEKRLPLQKLSDNCQLGEEQK